MKNPLSILKEDYIFYVKNDYFFTPILLHVFIMKSKKSPTTPQIIEITYFILSSDEISECQSIA